MLAADPIMLATARQARGLTQTELAREAGLSQAFISKAEATQVELDGDRLQRVADVLRYPLALLCMPTDAHSLVSACAFHRKRSALPVSKIRQVHACLDLARVQTEELLRDVLAPVVRLQRARPSSDGEVGPREIARQVRAELELPDGPVDDLTRAVESAGVIVLNWDLGHRHGDAVSQWLQGHRPIMLMYGAAPGDRLRFSTGHELGHLIMHSEPVEQQEQQADMFASELLMPALVIRPELQNLDMPSLARLKARWGVSMAALIRRARDLGAISDYRYKELNIEMSKSGWRTREPVDIPHERPSLVSDAVNHLRSKGLDDEAIAERGRMDVSDLKMIVDQQGAS